MGRCAALLLLVSASLPGCAGRGLTGWVWTGVAHEEPQMPTTVRISPKGDVAIFYTTDVATTKFDWWGGDMGWLGGRSGLQTTPVSRCRGLVVPAADMQKLLAAGSAGTVAVVREEDLASFVRPRDPGSRRDFAESSIRGLAQWREVPSAPASGTIQFAYGKKGETDGGEAPGKPKEATVKMRLPTRSSPAVRGVPVRVLLTPPAILGDATVDAGRVTLIAGAVVTAPVWVPVVIVAWISSRDSHGGGGWGGFY